VAVGAYEIAFGDLVQNPALAVRPQKVAHIRELLVAWAVVPLHGCRVEGDAAVGAGLPFLQAEIPGDELRMALFLLTEARRAGRTVVGGVVTTAAGLAPCLVTTTAAMERGQLLLFAAPSTPLRHGGEARRRSGQMAIRPATKPVIQV
jgi:hypothetical protein